MSTWTDTETIALLLALVDRNGTGIKWGDVNLPEGRTIKACMHKVDGLRNSVKTAKTAPRESPTKNPSKKTTSNSAGHAIGDDDDETAKPKKASKKAAGKPNANVKAEDDGAEAGPEAKTIKRKASTPTEGGVKKTKKSNKAKSDAVAEEDHEA